MDTAAPSIAQVFDAGGFVSRATAAMDLPALEALHDIAFGPGALARTAYRIREGQPPFTPFCRVLHHGSELVAAIRYTEILIGGQKGALMLGPLAVAPTYANKGYGRRLIAESLDAAALAGVALVLLVGDPPYYARFGFRPVPPRQMALPGPVDPNRLLMLDLQQSAPGGGPALNYAGRVKGAS